MHIYNFIITYIYIYIYIIYNEFPADLVTKEKKVHLKFENMMSNTHI